MNKPEQDNYTGKATASDIPFSVFLNTFRERMKNVFHVRANINDMALQRGMPPFVMREILSSNPLSVSIPVRYGGRGERIGELLAVLDAASYESLSLSLTIGINSGLFIQPVAKYALEEIRQPVFDRFLNHQNMGGLMITEPRFGSDALNMQTCYTNNNNTYHIQGVKHWAGLTGWAEFWLLTARERTASGDLKRDIDFFVCDVTAPGQHIEVEEYFENLGLYQIPYGRNRLNLEIPASQKLVPHSTGVKMMLDLLHRSRMQFPGMAIGFIQRMLDESISHTRGRQVGRHKLFDYDQVQHRLARLQASYTISSAMCLNSSRRAGVEKDLSQEGLEANSIKSVVTDLMQEAAQSATQLIGAQAYKLNNIVGRGITDSRPFQIFEGSNDILYAQISEALMKMMKKSSESNLFRFLNNLDLTHRSADMLKKIIDFKLDTNLPQRKMVELGKALGRIVSSEMVINLGESGFRKDMVDNGLKMLHHEISNIISSFHHKNNTVVVNDYKDDSSWTKLLNLT
jgi:alkylation response protein AidB-like acyl-CoA dehydrogenase